MRPAGAPSGLGPEDRVQREDGLLELHKARSTCHEWELGWSQYMTLPSERLSTSVRPLHPSQPTRHTLPIICETCQQHGPSDSQWHFCNSNEHMPFCLWWTPKNVFDTGSVKYEEEVSNADMFQANWLPSAVVV